MPAHVQVVADVRGLALGLVYSARASVRAAALSGRGVYWSRSRGGLWRKGDLSGAWQVFFVGLSVGRASPALSVRAPRPLSLSLSPDTGAAQDRSGLRR
jgi:hypothetical protein